MRQSLETAGGIPRAFTKVHTFCPYSMMSQGQKLYQSIPVGLSLRSVVRVVSIFLFMVIHLTL
jgi:hypothetical protein